MEKIVIIGNGIAGTTCARFLRKYSDHQIVMISDETPYFYSRTALMYVYMGHMRFEDLKPYEDWFWEENDIELIHDRVENLDLDNKILFCQKGNQISYSKLILATGSKTQTFGWSGLDLTGVFGMYHKQDLDRLEAMTNTITRGVIVGGGLIGVELAEMLHSRGKEVTMLVRERSYFDHILPCEESQMVTKHIQKRGIDLKLGQNLKEIVGKNGSVSSVLVSETNEEIDCQFVGITTGVKPNIDFLKETNLEINRGIVVNSRFETSVTNVYAIGDCAEISTPSEGRKAIEPLWYTGRMMGENLAYNLSHEPIDYSPGIWFNSAKFFDIEYQVYGNIQPKLEDGHQTLLWIDHSNEKSIRINFNEKNEVIGFNLMGVRYRHEVCEKWVAQKTDIEEVLQNLKLANFDPEFYKTYEQEIVEIYNQKFNKSLKLKAKRNLSSVFQFLKRGNEN